MISIPFFKKFQKTDILAVDWGVKEIKWAKLKEISPERYGLAFLDSFEIPPDAVRMVSAIREFCEQNKFVGARAAICLQDETLHIRRLDLPKMPEEDLKEAVRWQLRDIAEGSMDAYTVRYSILKEDENAETARLNLLAYCIKTSVIEKQVALLEKAGLSPFFLEPTPVSLASCLERVYPSTEKDCVACVDIGWKRVYFLSIVNGKLHFVRALAGVTLEQAGILKEEYPARLAMEIQRGIDSFSIIHKDEKIEKLFLAGGGAGREGLKDFLSKNLGVPTEILNPFQGIEELESFPMANQNPYLFGGALGLALLKP